MFVPCNDCGPDGGMYLTGWTAAPENRAICNSCASERVFGGKDGRGQIPQTGPTEVRPETPPVPTSGKDGRLPVAVGRPARADEAPVPANPGTVPSGGIPPQSSTANTPVPGTFSVWCERCGERILVDSVDHAVGHMLEYHPRIVEVLVSDWFGGELR